MIPFEHNGYGFEDHGRECWCESCKKTQWPEDLRAVVWIRPGTMLGYYHNYRPPHTSRTWAASFIIRRYLRGERSA